MRVVEKRVRSHSQLMPTSYRSFAAFIFARAHLSYVCVLAYLQHNAYYIECTKTISCVIILSEVNVCVLVSYMWWLAWVGIGTGFKSFPYIYSLVRSTWTNLRYTYYDVNNLQLMTTMRFDILLLQLFNTLMASFPFAHTFCIVLRLTLTTDHRCGNWSFTSTSFMCIIIIAVYDDIYNHDYSEMRAIHPVTLTSTHTHTYTKHI